MSEGTIEVVSPVPGIVSQIPVRAGDSVGEGDAVVMISSMKMEIAVAAESAGTVRAVLVEEGQELEAGDPVVRLSTA